MSDPPTLLDDLRRNWLEVALGALFVLLLVLLLIPPALPKGVVAVRDIESGSDITPADLTLVPMLGTPDFPAIGDVAGFVAGRRIAAGEPIRRSALRSAYAVASRGIAAGSVLQASDAPLQTAPFVEGGLRDLSFVGSPAAIAIPKDSVVRPSMVGTHDPKALRALRTIQPYRFLSAADLSRPPLARTCAVVPIAAGAVVTPSALVSIGAQFNQIMKITLKEAMPDGAHGAQVVIHDTAAAGKKVDAQILSAAGNEAVIALTLDSAQTLAKFTELRAVRKIE